MGNLRADLESLQRDVLAGRARRRAILKRGAALGLSAPLIAGLLAACGDDETTESTATTESGTSSESAATATSDEAESTEASGEATAEGTTATGESSSGETPGKGRGAGDLLRLLVWQAPTSLNTHFSQGDKDGLAARLVLEPLVNIMSDGTLQPVLAAEAPTLENGGVAADGKSVTYKLKQGVTWSDGEPFTADDVLFTWEYATNPDVAATTFAVYDVISEVEVVDEHTITFKFEEPNPAWATAFAGSFSGAVLPKHLLADSVGAEARNAPFNLSPIGTGPYKVTEFRPGDVGRAGRPAVWRDGLLLEPADREGGRRADGRQRGDGCPRRDAGQLGRAAAAQLRRPEHRGGRRALGAHHDPPVLQR